MLDVGLREDCEEDLVDVGCNADLYVANQNQNQNQESTDTDSIREAHVGDALSLFAFNFNGSRSSQDLLYFPRSLSLD